MRINTPQVSALRRTGERGTSPFRHVGHLGIDDDMTIIQISETLIAKYLSECEARSLKQTTITDRRRILRRLGEWAAPDPVLYLSTDRLRDWQVYTSTTVTPATLHSYLVALRMFYAWAHDRRLINVDPAAELDMPRLPKRLPHPIDDDALRRCIEAAPPDLAAILGLARFGGLRACEIARLAWPSVRWADGRILIDGKGDRQRVVPMLGELPPLLAALPAVDGRRVGPVIPRRDGGKGHNTPHNISQLATVYFREQGCEGRLHSCRHGFATAIVANGGSVVAAQRLLGHEHLSTTQIYVDVTADELEDAVSRAAVWRSSRRRTGRRR